jgi:hypothetical protein
MSKTYVVSHTDPNLKLMFLTVQETERDLGACGLADEERCHGWGSRSMTRSGCTLQETERDLGACSLADEKRCHDWGSGSLGLECERNKASSESIGESMCPHTIYGKHIAGYKV